MAPLGASGDTDFCIQKFTTTIRSAIVEILLLELLALQGGSADSETETQLLLQIRSQVRTLSISQVIITLLHSACYLDD